MFGVFSRKKNKNKTDVNDLVYIQVRSANTGAFHIVDKYELELAENSSAVDAMCGYNSWVHTNSPLNGDSDTIRSSIDTQHANWWWCPSCASIITGLPKEVFITARKNNL